jgi:hypothetical protein
MVRSHKPLISLLLMFAVTPAALAGNLYRCPSKSGPPVYSDQECPGGQVVGKVPDRQPPAAEPAGNELNINVEVNNNIQAPASPAPPPAVDYSTGPRGMPFEVFRRLDRGMSEGEVFAIAGPPERETVDSSNFYTGTQRKSYYYVNVGRNASVTRIHFTNGTVTRIERDLAPY